MTKIMSGSVLMRATHATHQVVAGEAILIHLNSGQYYSLNPPGAGRWEHLEGRTALERWGTALAAACNIPEQVADVTQDLIELAQGLANEGLVVAR